MTSVVLEEDLGEEKGGDGVEATCLKNTFSMLPHASMHVRTESKQLCVCAHGIVDLFLSEFYTREMYYFCTFPICFYNVDEMVLEHADMESVMVCGKLGEPIWSLKRRYWLQSVLV